MIPIIEAGLADDKLPIERAALMASFCEWALSVESDSEESVALVDSINHGLERLKQQFALVEA